MVPSYGRVDAKKRVENGKVQKLATEHRSLQRKILRIGKQFRAQVDDPEGISVHPQRGGNRGPPDVASEVFERAILSIP